MPGDDTCVARVTSRARSPELDAGADRGARLDPPRAGDPEISRVKGTPELTGLAFSGERAYGPAIAHAHSDENCLEPSNFKVTRPKISSVTVYKYV